MHFGPTLAIAVCLALAAMAGLICAVVLLVEPKPIPGLPASQRQNAETALFAVSLLVVAPAALVLARRGSAAVSRGPNAAALPALAALLALALALVVLAARGIDAVAGGGPEVLLGGALAWLAAAAAALRRAGGGRWPLAARAARLTRPLWVAGAAATAATPLTVADPGSLSVPVLVIGAGAVYAALRLRLPVLGGRLGPAADAAAVIALGLLIPDMVVVRPEDPGLSELDRYLASIMRFHQNFLVGPANQVLGGEVLLRDTASQYGVGSIYFLAGWFKLLTISYGSFALLDGLLTAGLFAIAYAVLRAAGCSRSLAGAAVAVGVVTLVFNRVYAVGMLPQEGPFRFGLPMLVVAGAVVAARVPRRAGLGRGVALAALGVSAIWALEAFAATAAVYAALACVEAWLAPAGGGALLRRRALQAGAAVLAAHLLFALAMLAGTGDLPGWGQYLAFLSQFLSGPLGDLTYDFSRWSAGLALGAGYLSSAIAVVALLRDRLELARELNAVVTALVGVTAYGLAIFAYFVDRSADHVLVYVALPALLAGTLWLTLLRHPRAQAPAAARSAAIAAGGAVAVLVVSVAASGVQRPLERSALSQLLPGGDSLRASVARLRAFPAIDPRAPEGERLLDAYMPGEKRSLVLVEPDLTVEVLTRRKRANELRLSNPREDDFTYDERLPGMIDAIRRVRPGRRMLVDASALAALALLRRNPNSKLLRQGGAAVSILQARALLELDRRFRLRLVRRGSGGLAVVELLDR